MGRIGISRIAEICSVRTVKVAVATTTVFVVGAALAPTPSLAAPQAWGPIAVTVAGGSGQLGKAYGDFANNGGVYATVGINYVDMFDNGIPVYVEVNWYYMYGGFPGSGTWKWYKKSQTERTQRMKYVPTELSHRLRYDSWAVRADIKVCEDRVRALDRCSGTESREFRQPYDDPY